MPTFKLHVKEVINFGKVSLVHVLCDNKVADLNYIFKGYNWVLVIKPIEVAVLSRVHRYLSPLWIIYGV